jgi:hypothetical protein
LVGGQLFLTNGIYLFIGFICFCFILYRLQQPFKPAIFTLVFVFHFIQISAWVWLSNYLGKDINYKSPHSGTAVICGYIALFFLFGPIIYFQNKIPIMSRAVLLKHADRLSLEKTFRAYIISFFVANALGAVALFIGGLAQIIISFINVKWVFFVLFGLQVLLKKRMKKEFYMVVAAEFLIGFFSFFSEFKTVIFYLAFIFLIFLAKIYLRQMILAIIVLIAGFFLGAFWSSIKGEYRGFLNQGSSSQTVQVSKNDALKKIVELSEKQDQSTFDESVITLLDRLQYTYHLAKAMDWVPDKVPYQNGDNWGLSLSFALTPRLLNPNKPIYEASSKATKYTGIGYAGAGQGVSVSLGYFADCYVDFGYFGMFIPILIIGFIYGLIYFYFIKHSSENFIFNYAVVAAIFMEFMAIEMDSTFLVGRMFATLLTFFALKVVFFPWVMKLLQSTGTNDIEAPATVNEAVLPDTDKQP